MILKKKYDINWLVLKELLQNFNYNVGDVCFFQSGNIMYCRPAHESNKKRNKTFKRFFKKCGWRLIINE